MTKAGTGHFFHLTYHGGAAAHVKVLYQGREHTRPLSGLPELVPGFRRLLQIRVPSAAAKERSTDPATIVVPHSGGSDAWVIFEVMLEDARATLTSWPGKNTGTGLIGRLALPSGARICVIHRIATGRAASWSGPGPTPDQRSEMRRMERIGSLAALIFGEEDDGTLWVLDLHTRGSWYWRTLARLRQAWERVRRRR